MTDLYLADVQPLLAPDMRSLWDVSEAMEVVDREIFPLLRGEPWKGTTDIKLTPWCTGGALRHKKRR